MEHRYYDLNRYFRSRFGCRVQKIAVDAGLTCPNRDGHLGRGGCIYCNALGSGSGALARGVSIDEQIQNGKKVLARRYKAKKFLVYFQAFSNTYAPPATLKRIYDEALQDTDIVGLSIGTRPDCVDEPILGLLQEYATKRLIWIEYGLQSIHDTTLKRINRGHDFDCFQKAVAASRNRGISICTHVILGLPGETRQQMMATARQIADLGLDGIKLHLLYVVKGTPLERHYHAGQYNCLSRAEYVDLVGEFLAYLPPTMVIQRLGSDPHPEELVAPSWALDRNTTFKAILRHLEQQDLCQGKYYPNSAISS